MPFYNLLRRALSCAPADPLEWLTLFWLDAGKSWFTPEDGNYLRMSYALGPNEGWIALWRVRLAVALFERLPTDLSNDAIDEFIKLVDTERLYSETATIFASGAPAVQNRIVERLKAAKAIPRQEFARALYDRGFALDIPDVERRPWQ